MLRKFMTTTAAAAIAVSSVSFVTFTTLALSTEMAVAGNGNGNGKGNGNGNGNGNNGNSNGNSRSNNSGGNGNGKIASTLGALNAAHANQNALDNAAPNSRVGMIATYQREAILTKELTAEAATALAALEALELTAPARTSGDVQIAIGNVQTAIENGQFLVDAALSAEPPLDTAELEFELAALGLELIALGLEYDEVLAYETAYEVAEGNSITAAAATAEQEIVEADALEASANKDVPTGGALEALRVLLGLN